MFHVLWSRRSGFNSRAREGRDAAAKSSLAMLARFNSRAREGRDEDFQVARSGLQGFNSRAREGRDGGFGNNELRIDSFNSRAREGRDAGGIFRTALADSFNSRAREGRDMLAEGADGRGETFQFTRPRGARRRRSATTRVTPRFNSRAREGRDRTTPTTPTPNTPFQFTRPRGARPRRRRRLARRGVSIHAPARGATGLDTRTPPRVSFNSRAREGRDLDDLHARRARNVSIHAPARGATRGRRPSRAASSFNSRAREGRDAAIRVDGVENISFNSRAREGRDAQQPARERRGLAVSIHAPARGATTKPDEIHAHALSFQFTRPRGARRPHREPAGGPRGVSIHAPARGATCRRWRLRASRRFNSRAREGRDPVRLSRRVREECFNSRAREGRDRALARRVRREDVSIHAPARGATCRLRRKTGVLVFQFTRPRGARPRRRRPAILVRCFNSRAREGRDVADRRPNRRLDVSIHAPARGATRVTTQTIGRYVFQFTRPRGARLPTASAYYCFELVSIHAPARGATTSTPTTPPRPAGFNSRAREGRD